MAYKTKSKSKASKATFKNCAGCKTKALCKAKGKCVKKGKK